MARGHDHQQQTRHSRLHPCFPAAGSNPITPITSYQIAAFSYRLHSSLLVYHQRARSPVLFRYLYFWHPTHQPTLPVPIPSHSRVRNSDLLICYSPHKSSPILPLGPPTRFPRYIPQPAWISPTSPHDPTPHMHIRPHSGGENNSTRTRTLRHALHTHTHTLHTHHRCPGCHGQRSSTGRLNNGWSVVRAVTYLKHTGRFGIRITHLSRKEKRFGISIMKIMSWKRGPKHLFLGPKHLFWGG